MAELSAATEALVSSRENAPIVIRLGFVSGSLQGAVAQELVRSAKANSRFRFHITEGSAKDLMDLLHQEKLDLAIVDVTSRDRSLHYRKLRQRDFYVAVPHGHPLSGQQELRAADLAPYPQIGFSHSMDHTFEDWASRPEVPQHFVGQVNTVTGALDLVQSGFGVTVVPGECIEARKGISYIPLLNRHQALYLCIVYDRWLDPPIWDFVERLLKSARQMQ